MDLIATAEAVAGLARGLLGQARDPFEWSDEGVRIAVILGTAIVLSILARLLVRRFRRRLEGTTHETQTIDLRRAATLTGALSATAVVVIWTLAFLLVLDNLNVNLAPLLASAGVVGVALGFGAQSIVKDTLSGFFILLEDQFGVGDVVELQTTANPINGKVEDLTLRTTSLRAFDGTVHSVPNGNIEVISNKSRGWGRAIVDVRLTYDEDVERVRGILDDLFDEIEREGLLDGWLTQQPTVLGVETLSDYAVVVRVTADTRASKRFDAERTLRERISARLAREGIRVPVPPAMTQRPGEAGL
jgi:moderate conductance mechanosensitive channel